MVLFLLITVTPAQWIIYYLLQKGMLDELQNFHLLDFGDFFPAKASQGLVQFLYCCEFCPSREKFLKKYEKKAVTINKEKPTAK